MSSVRNAGESAICPMRAQPSAEIVRVECAKCKRECDLSGARATLCGDRACRVCEMQARVRFVPCAHNPLRRSCVSSARNASESAICPVPAQPSAEIVRVECAKCKRECDLSHARATLCGDRARRAREMQARVRFVRCPRNPLRRSCVSSARNASESAICPVPAQPSAEIVRVERAKCKRECDLSGARATLCGDRARRVREMQARVRFVPCARNPLRRSCASSARNASESAICPVPAQTSAEIVRVECAKCKRECDLSHARATLCGDRARRAREMQARVRFVRCPRNPLRRPCVSSVRSAGRTGQDFEPWSLVLNLLQHRSQGQTPSYPSAVGFLLKRGRRHPGEALTIRAPATGPCPCRRPSVGNRRLYTLAAPAADPFVGPRGYPRPTPARIRPTDLYVSCAGCSKNVQKHRFLQCFVAFGVHDRVPVVSVLRAARTGLIDISWVLGT